MKTFLDSFTAHPKSVGETYVEHLHVASGFGFAMVLGGIACIIHGILPGLFVKTGSQTILRLHERMVTKRTTKNLPAGVMDFVI